MRLPVSFAALGLLAITSHALAEPAVSIVGTWLTEDGRAKIRTEMCGEGNEKVCGYVVWLKEPLTDKGQPRLDIKNPDPAKRSRPSLGLELLEKLEPGEEKNHYAGEIYNAEDGKKYSVTLSVEKPEELEVRGCLLKFLCKSQSWQRVADLPIPNAKVVQTSTKAKPGTPGHLHDNQPAAQ